MYCVDEISCVCYTGVVLRYVCVIKRELELESVCGHL